MQKSQGAMMGEQQHRTCLNQLISWSAEVDCHDHRAVAAEVDRMLSCNGQRMCPAHLACSWLAAELASHLANRYR